MRKFLRQIAHVWMKDIFIEIRRKEILFSTVGFCAIILLLFAFSFYSWTSSSQQPDVELSPQVQAGALWLALLLSGTIGVHRFLFREQQAGAWQALLASPISRAALYLGKTLSLCCLMLFLLLILLPLASLFLHVNLSYKVCPLLALGVVGFSAVSTLFSAGLGRSKARDLLLPLLVYPLLTPLFLSGVQATSLILQHQPDTSDAISQWMLFLIAFDGLVVILGMWLFEPLISVE